MRVRHTVPAEEAEEHERSQHCPCEPSQRVVAAPLRRPIVTLTHHRLTTKETP